MHRSAPRKRNAVHLKLFSTLTAALLIVGGLTLFGAARPALAQPAEPEEPQTEQERHYVGSQECMACHRDLTESHAGTSHDQALVNVEENKRPLLADFAAGDEVRTILLPGEDEARPFTADDISYAIGSGTYAQRYLYTLEDGRYMVLPAEWNALTGQWQPFTLSESWPDAAYDWTTQCAYCHTTNLNVEQGLWMEDGVQCEACHGPGSEHIDAAEATSPILTSRERTAVEQSIVLGLDAAVCGQCHSQGTEPQHGLPFPLDYLPGEALLDREVFRLVSERSAVHWWRTGQAQQKYMQFNEWITTVHAEAFLTVTQHPDFTPGCLSCHNVTFSRAARLVADIEANDDRERIDILLDEADINIGNVYQIEWDELKALVLEELEFDAAAIDDTAPFLPQVLPQLVSRMQAEDELADGQILPQSLAGVLQTAGEGTNDDHTNLALGVTCAACHSPHSTADAPASLISDSYTVCTDCHQSAEPIYGLHHPAQEVFEGRVLVEGISSSPSAHFTADVTCATCHMPQVPVNMGVRISHTLSPILPASAAQTEAIQDSCTGCHGDQIEGQSIQQLINSIQTDIRTRYQAVRTAADDTSPAWIHDVLQAVEGDGSWGFHNYGYTAALLTRAERELGLMEETAPLVLPDIPVQAPPAQPRPPSQVVTGDGGLTTPSIILLAIAGAIILTSAYLFLIRGRNQ